jgi:hypothetical protein
MGIVLCLIAQSCADAIEMNVPKQLEEINFLLNKDRLKSTPKKWPIFRPSPIKSLGKNSIDMPHGTT